MTDRDHISFGKKRAYRIDVTGDIEGITADIKYGKPPLKTRTDAEHFRDVMKTHLEKLGYEESQGFGDDGVGPKEKIVHFSCDCPRKKTIKSIEADLEAAYIRTIRTVEESRSARKEGIHRKESSAEFDVILGALQTHTNAFSDPTLIPTIAGTILTQLSNHRGR